MIQSSDLVKERKDCDDLAKSFTQIRINDSIKKK